MLRMIRSWFKPTKSSAESERLGQQLELSWIIGRMPVAIAERDRLKRNKKAYAYLDKLIAQHRLRQLELEKALGIEG